jgi:hypothetical protein
LSQTQAINFDVIKKNQKYDWTKGGGIEVNNTFE